MWASTCGSSSIPPPAVGVTTVMVPADRLADQIHGRVGPVCQAAGVSTVAPAVDPVAKARLAELVRDLAVAHGRFTLASGKVADYYIDGRLPSLHHEAAPLIGVLLRELTADWDYSA